MKPSWLTQIIFLLVWIAVLSQGHLVRAQEQATITLSATPAFAGNYTLGTWLPITVDITNTGMALSAVLVADLPGSQTRYTQLVDLPGGGQRQFVLYVAMEQMAHEVLLTIEQDQAVLARQKLTVRPRSDERMLAILARTDPHIALPQREDLQSSPFTSLHITPADLPDHAAGLGSLGLILLNELPADSLRPAQIAALREWVHTGGHLVLGGGAAAKAVQSWLPADLHAATIGAALQLDDTPLAEFAEAAGPGQIPAVRLVALPGGTSAGVLSEPAWVSRPFGNGKITQLAFDPALPALQHWAAAPAFWDALLQPALLVNTAFGTQTRADYIQEQILAGALTALPTLKQPPVDLLFVILIAYTLLIGPILALTLRRFDRQAWSWLIIPVVACGLGLLLMTLAFMLRATDQVVTQISLVEDLGSDQARARTFVGVLAPQAQHFTASVPAGALIRPIRSTGGTYNTVSGVEGDLSQAQERLALDIAAWKFQAAALEQQVSLPSLTATVILDDQGERISVKNTTGQPLRDVVAAYGDRVLSLGDMDPEQVLEGYWMPVGAGSNTPLSALIFADAVAEASRPGQVPNRQIQIKQSLIDAAVNRGTPSSDLGPLILAWMDHSPVPVSVDAPNAAQQSLTLLVAHARVQASGSLALSAGWLRPDPVLSQRSVCLSTMGVGIHASPSPVDLTFRLQDDLTPIRARTVVIHLDSSNTWPNAGIRTEIYDYAHKAWVAQTYDGPGDLTIADAAPYLVEGQLRLRLSGSIERAGCLSISATLQGDMP